MSPNEIPQRLQVILALINGMLEVTHGKAFDHIRGNFLYERAAERVLELISEAAESLPEMLPARYPAEQFAPVLTLAEKLLDNDYRIETFEMWRLLTRDFPALRDALIQILTDFGFEI